MKDINGKFYPLWEQFVEKKDEYIGGRMINYDMGMEAETEIVDITLGPNGLDSAIFCFVGKDWTFGFDVKYGGVSCGGKVLTLSSTYCGECEIYRKKDL